MANKILDHDAQLQLILDDEITTLPKEGFSVTANYLGLAGNIALFANGITSHPFWEGDFSEFDYPSGAADAAAFKVLVDAKLTIDDVRGGGGSVVAGLKEISYRA